MYTIRMHAAGVSMRLKVKNALERKINLSTKSRFTAEFELQGNGYDIHVKPIRLRAAKPYCGQHPGECLVGGPRRKGRWLEWEDWVEFNGLVNDVLDQLQVSADVWSVPPEKMDQGSKMWIRRGTKRRVRYDWDERETGGFRPIRVWNHGTDDQF